MIPKNIFIVSNRLPVTIVKTEDGFSIKPSSGGLATALQSVFQQQDSRWIGWPGIIPQNKEEEEQITQLLEPLRCIPVFLTEQEHNDYYNGFSNSILWPLFHYHPGHCVMEQLYWETYKQVNIKFAETICRYTGKTDFVWIHDYQLMLVPQYTDRPYMSYFHHTHFPSVEVFGIIPWRKELLQGIYKCKHIVFQTKRDCRNFKQAYQCFVSDQAPEVSPQSSVQNHISYHPISIDAQDFSSISDSPKVKDIANNIKQAFEPFKVILSVDRLDYSKGVLERLTAFKELLIDYPKYHKQVVLVMIVVPSRTNVVSYEKHKKKVDELVGNINAMFAVPEWRPVHYYYQHFDRETLCAYYSTADVCLITSLRDGLNLVSKEYVACRNNNNGVLILSEMAGSANELQTALKVHPYDTKQIKEAVNYALAISPEEEQTRMANLRTQVFNHTIFDWVNTIFQEVFDLYENLSYTVDNYLSPTLMELLKTQFKEAEKRYILLDYDGCLRDIEPHPEMATPTEAIYQLLEKLIGLPHTEVYLISGRSKSDMQEWFSHTGANIIAEHGVWYKKHNENWVDLRENDKVHKEYFFNFLNYFQERIPGSFLEEKSTGYCLHFRGCKPAHVSKYLDKLVNGFIEEVKTNNLPYRCTVTCMEFEILPMGCNKGKAVNEIISFSDNAFILAAGDDDTDEDMFEVLPSTAFTFKIGQKDTCAKIRVPQVNRFVDFLSNLADYSLTDK